MKSKRDRVAAPPRRCLLPPLLLLFLHTSHILLFSTKRKTLLVQVPSARLDSLSRGSCLASLFRVVVKLLDSHASDSIAKVRTYPPSWRFVRSPQRINVTQPTLVIIATRGLCKVELVCLFSSLRVLPSSLSFLLYFYLSFSEILGTREMFARSKSFCF